MSIITLNTRSLPDSAVTTAKIAADAVTDAKIADDVVGTEHLTAGEVDATALGADSVTAAKINNDIISGSTELSSAPADTDEFLVSDAGTLKRIDYSLIKGGGITEADMYRLTANSSNSDVTPLTSWERVDDATFSKMGTGISVSSGIFSFPSTGLYLVRIRAMTLADGAYDNLRLRGSNDNFSSNNDVLALQTYGVSSSGNPYQSNVLETFFNCTNVSTHKVKFDFHASNNLNILGDTNDNVTTICFIRLGDSQ